MQIRSELGHPTGRLMIILGLAVPVPRGFATYLLYIFTNPHTECPLTAGGYGWFRKIRGPFVIGLIIVDNRTVTIIIKGMKHTICFHFQI